jgi:hypothetical protein
MKSVAKYSRRPPDRTVTYKTLHEFLDRCSSRVRNALASASIEGAAALRYVPSPLRDAPMTSGTSALYSSFVSRLPSVNWDSLGYPMIRS